MKQFSIGSGSPLHRCFVALRPSEEVVEYIATLIDQLRGHRASVRWVERDNLHLTLRFLGEITSEQVQTVRGAMLEENRLGRLQMRLSGLGAFPTMRSPKVLWTGVEPRNREDADALAHLHGRAERWARAAGLEPENRRFSPHVTIGRVKMPLERMRELMEDLGGRTCVSPWCTVERVLLVESELTPHGARYTDVAEVELHV